MVRASWATVAALACAPGCADDLDLPPLSIETERTRIAVGDGEHLPCAGDLAALDAHVGELEHLSGLREPEPLQVFLLSDVTDICGGDGVIACEGDGQIFGAWMSVRHEVGHAIASPALDFGGRAFLSEGYAELAAGHTSRKSTIPMRADDLDQAELANYVTAGHFARYLVQTHGWTTYQDAVASGDVESVLGQPLHVLADDYEREAPAAYPPRHPCPYPELPRIDDGLWQESLTFSCASQQATQYEFPDFSGTDGAAVWRSVTLDAGTYSLEVEGGAEAVVLGCHTDVLSDLPEPPSNGDVWNEVDQRPATTFAAGVEHELQLTAGTYRVAMSSGNEGEETMRLRLRRLER